MLSPSLPENATEIPTSCNDLAPQGVGSRHFADGECRYRVLP